MSDISNTPTSTPTSTPTNTHTHSVYIHFLQPSRIIIYTFDFPPAHASATLDYDGATLHLATRQTLNRLSSTPGGQPIIQAAVNEWNRWRVGVAVPTMPNTPSNPSQEPHHGQNGTGAG